MGKILQGRSTRSSKIREVEIKSYSLIQIYLLARVGDK